MSPNRLDAFTQNAVTGLATVLSIAIAASGASAQDGFPTFLDPADTVILMVDHQSGLMHAVGDIDHRTLRDNVTALMRAAEFFDIPVIASTSAALGPNGPLIGEILGNAPDALSIARNGPINAFDSEAFRQAVEETGRKTLVIAGILTSVCVAFPALTAQEEGYNVYAVIDASGDVSEMVADVTTERLAAEGVTVASTFQVLSELHGSWTAENAPAMASIYSDVAPGYGAVIESFYGPREDVGG